MVIFISERWPESNSFYDKLIISFFQSISASTTDGFNSVDIGAMSAASLTILMVLMFIGASPGSTGGGMKTTTLAVLFIAVESYFRGKERINAFYRELSFETVTKSFVLFSLFIVITVVDAVILSNTEKASYIQVLFEIVSALGNTGLSTGITPELSFIGKLTLTITMFIGRV
jgi:trk system potassium uptake protein TrkH